MSEIEFPQGIPGMQIDPLIGGDYEHAPPDTHGQSTLSKSEQEKEQPEYGVPWIPFPNFNSPDYDLSLHAQALASMTSATNEVINNLLDAWSKSVAIIAEMSKEQARVDDIQRNIQRVMEEMHQLVNVAQNQTNPESAKAILGTAMVMLSIVMAGPAAFNIGSVQYSGMNLVEKVSTAMINVGALSTELTAQFALIGSMFMIPVVNIAVSNALANAGGKPGQVTDQEFANAFADQVIRFVSNPAYDNMIKYSVLSHNPELENKPDQLAKMMQLMKLTMLFSAVALAYRVETGGMTSDEIMAIVDGTLELPEGDNRIELGKLIQKELEKLPEDLKQEVLNTFAEYFDQNPDVDELANPMNLLLFASESMDYEKLTESQT